MKNPESNLPPGFRFHPTDEELILHYLRNKVSSIPFPVSIIADVDIYKFNPWDLPDKAVFGEKEWYFFSPRDRKYPNGARPNRAAASGYWKATGTDKLIVASSPGVLGVQQHDNNNNNNNNNIGVKKALVFYKGRPPKGIKTNWIMHEYRLSDASTCSNVKPINKPKHSSTTTTMRLDDWVLCRIYMKTHASPPSVAAAIATTSDHDQQQEEEEQFVQETLLPSLRNPTIINRTLISQKSTSFSNLLEAMDYSMLSSFLSDNPTAFDHNSTPTLLHNANMISDQPLLNNCYPPTTNGGGGGGSYLLQKLPQLNSPIIPNMENKLKRSISNNIDHEDMQNPSKKRVNSCSFTNTTSQTDHMVHHNHQYNFLNQQLLLSPHLQFRG